MTEIKRITSRDNSRLVHARRARDGRESGLIFIEGGRLAEEALSSNLEVRECFVTEDFRYPEVVDTVAAMGAAITELPENLMNSISAVDNPQGIVLIAKRPLISAKNFELTGSLPLFIFLFEINNPSNLGAVLRSAEAAGASGVFVSAGSADVFSPKALRASMGSAFRIAITEKAFLEETVKNASQLGVSCIALDTSASASYLDVDWRQPTLLILGSEAHGLSDLQLKTIGKAVNIPMVEAVESLNLAVAAGIVLFEAKRQHS